jgi:hypothetical protein
MSEPLPRLTWRTYTSLLYRKETPANDVGQALWLFVNLIRLLHMPLWLRFGCDCGALVYHQF